MVQIKLFQVVAFLLAASAIAAPVDDKNPKSDIDRTPRPVNGVMSVMKDGELVTVWPSNPRGGALRKSRLKSHLPLGPPLALK
jgi:hypothetical protein